MKTYLNRRRIFLFLVLLLIGGAGSLLFFQRDDSQGRVILTNDRPQPRKSRLGFLGSWSYPLRGWLFSVKSRLLGPPAVVMLDLQIFSLRPAPESEFILTNIALLPGALADDHGLRAWVFPPADLNTLTQRLASVASLISRPRLVTASGQSAQMSAANLFSLPQGLVPAGIFVDFFPHARRGSLEVVTFITLSEAVTNRAGSSTQPASLMIQTNLAVGVRLQMPPGHAAFLLHRNRENGKLTAALLTPSVQWPKK